MKGTGPTLRPQSRVLSPVLSRLPTDERVVWLTIDDGPSDDTRAMLDLLDAHGARATFFLVGARAQARPELVAEIVRRGHGINLRQPRRRGRGTNIHWPRT